MSDRFANQMKYAPMPDPDRVIFENHWNDSALTMIEYRKFCENPSTYINNLIHEVETALRDRDSYRDLGMRTNDALALIETRYQTLVTEWGREKRATETLAKVREILGTITDHAKRGCAARDICEDHANIVTLAKVLNDYLGEE